MVFFPVYLLKNHSISLAINWVRLNLSTDILGPRAYDLFFRLRFLAARKLGRAPKMCKKGEGKLPSPSPLLPLFVLAPIFARPKSENWLQWAEKSTITLATQASPSCIPPNRSWTSGVMGSCWSLIKTIALITSAGAAIRQWCVLITSLCTLKELKLELWLTSILVWLLVGTPALWELTSIHQRWSFFALVWSGCKF